jgi:hypothetical protein
MKNKKIQTSIKKKKIKKINRKNKKQKLRKPKIRLLAKEGSMRKGLDQYLMSYLETLNLELFYLKKIIKALLDKNKIDILKSHNF